MTDPIGSLSPVAAFPGGGTDAGAIPSAAVSAPALPSPPAADSKAVNPDMQALAEALNQHVQDLQTSLHFQVDKVTGQMVLSVIDLQNNQVLMQVPSPEALAIAQSLQHLKLQLMNQTA